MYIEEREQKTKRCI